MSTNVIMFVEDHPSLQAIDQKTEAAGKLTLLPMTAICLQSYYFF